MQANRIKRRLARLIIVALTIGGAASAGCWDKEIHEASARPVRISAQHAPAAPTARGTAPAPAQVG
jgi:hypothetical protein